MKRNLIENYLLHKNETCDYFYITKIQMFPNSKFEVSFVEEPRQQAKILGSIPENIMNRTVHYLKIEDEYYLIFFINNIMKLSTKSNNILLYKNNNFSNKLLYNLCKDHIHNVLNMIFAIFQTNSVNKETQQCSL